jgi:hypothetical protein
MVVVNKGYSMAAMFMDRLVTMPLNYIIPLCSISFPLYKISTVYESAWLPQNTEDMASNEAASPTDTHIFPVTNEGGQPGFKSTN